MNAWKGSGHVEKVVNELTFRVCVYAGVSVASASVEEEEDVEEDDECEGEALGRVSLALFAFASLIFSSARRRDSVQRRSVHVCNERA